MLPLPGSEPSLNKEGLLGSVHIFLLEGDGSSGASYLIKGCSLTLDLPRVPSSVPVVRRDTSGPGNEGGGGGVEAQQVLGRLCLCFYLRAVCFINTQVKGSVERIPSFSYLETTNCNSNSIHVCDICKKVYLSLSLVPGTEPLKPLQFPK